MGFNMFARFFILCLFILAGCKEPETKNESFDKGVLAATETAFAKSMADRSFDDFASFVAKDAVFLNGGNPLRGKEEILNHWKAFFTEEKAPFSWSPELAEVGGVNIGTTEGPVKNPDGKVIARFYSTWQLQPDGKWLIVFDNGYDVCK